MIRHLITLKQRSEYSTISHVVEMLVGAKSHRRPRYPLHACRRARGSAGSHRLKTCQRRSNLCAAFSSHRKPRCKPQPFYEVAVVTIDYTFGGLFQLMLAGEMERVIGRRKMTRDLQQLSDHIIVCGFGRMGQHLVEDLSNESQMVVVIDNDFQVVEEAVAQGLLCVAGDATEEELLESVQIRSAKTIVTTLPSDADSVFITLTARNLNPTLQIVARAEHRSTEKKLRQAGADRIVMPTIVGAKQMVRMITRPTTADLIDLVTESSFQDVELDEITIGATSPLAGKRLQDVSLLQNLDLLIVAIKRPEEGLTFNPRSNVLFQSDDTIMVMGHPANIQRFREQS